MNYILNVSYWSDAMTGQSSYLNTCTRCLSLGVSRCMKDKKKNTVHSSISFIFKKDNILLFFVTFLC